MSQISSDRAYHCRFSETLQFSRRVAPRPLPINPPPHPAVGVAIAQLGRQARLAFVVIAVQGGEAQQAGGDADGGEAGVAGNGPPWFMPGLTTSPVGILSLARPLWSQRTCAERIANRHPVGVRSRPPGWHLPDRNGCVPLGWEDHNYAFIYP